MMQGEIVSSPAGSSNQTEFTAALHLDTTIAPSFGTSIGDKEEGIL